MAPPVYAGRTRVKKIAFFSSRSRGSSENLSPCLALSQRGVNGETPPGDMLTLLLAGGPAADEARNPLSRRRVFFITGRNLSIFLVVFHATDRLCIKNPSAMEGTASFRGRTDDAHPTPAASSGILRSTLYALFFFFDAANRSLLGRGDLSSPLSGGLQLGGCISPPFLSPSLLPFPRYSMNSSFSQ